MTPARQNRHKGQPVHGHPQSHPQGRTPKDRQGGSTQQKAPTSDNVGQHTHTHTESGHPGFQASEREAPKIQEPVSLPQGPHHQPHKPHPQPTTRKTQHAACTVWRGAILESLERHPAHSYSSKDLHPGAKSPYRQKTQVTPVWSPFHTIIGLGSFFRCGEGTCSELQLILCGSGQQWLGEAQAPLSKQFVE